MKLLDAGVVSALVCMVKQESPALTEACRECIARWENGSKSLPLTVLSVDFLLMLFPTTGSSWLWWNDRKIGAKWWHRVEER